MSAKLMKRIFVVAIATTFVVLAGCESAGPLRSVTLAESGSLLQRENLVGEPCRVQVLGGKNVPAAASRAFAVFCGDWEHPSGRVYEAPGATLEDSAANAPWWRGVVDARASCAAATRGQILDGLPALDLDCRLRNGGWPYTALVTVAEGKRYFADGVPAVRGVLEQAIGVAAGRIDSAMENTPASVTAALQRLEADLQGRLYGAGDLDTYYALMLAGQYHNSVRDFVAAERRYREALAVQQRLIGVDAPETADALAHIALELSNQTRFVEAEGLFDRVGELVDQRAEAAEKARYLSYRAYHEANQQHFEAALDLARQTTALRRTAAAGRGGQVVLSGGRGDRVLPASVGNPSGADVVQSLYLEAAMLQRLGRFTDAERIVQDATVELLSAPQVPPVWEPQLMMLEAGVDRASGDGQRAGEVLAAAVDRFQQIAPKERPTALSYLALGESHLAAGRIDAGLAAYRTAVEMIGQRGGSVRLDVLLPYFRSVMAIAQDDPARKPALYRDLFAAGQLVRSSRTAHDIALVSARLAARESGAGSVVRALQDAQDERYRIHLSYQAELAQGVNPQRITTLADRLVDINRQIQDLKLQVQAIAPGYNQLVAASVEADRLLRALRPEEAMVQVLLGHTGSILVLATAGGLEFHELPITLAEAERRVAELRTGLAPTAQGGIPDFDPAAAHALYQRLLAPVDARIADVKHLVTVPTGPLLSLPFAVLVTAAHDGDDYASVPWLVQRSAISLAPSIRSFVDLRASIEPSRATKAFIGFGDFQPYSTDALANARLELPPECINNTSLLASYRTNLASLGALPQTAPEVGAVARAFGSDTEVLLADAFNESHLKAARLNDYRIVYFATHALLPAEFDCQPEASLVTSLPDTLAHNEDGLLQVSEVLRLDLDADLVVLSACNTGGAEGKEGGESLSGLARAFFFAGARSLLVSHWAVEDRSTADLMVRLFERGRKAGGVSLSESLRRAQLSLIADARKRGMGFRSHPLFWGAFTLVGDGGRGVVTR